MDNEGRLNDIVNGLLDLHRQHDIPIIFSAHPRTINRLAEFDITYPRVSGLLNRLVTWSSYNLKRMSLVLTDSGGVQEETCILRVPCVTLRNNTERPETIESDRISLLGRILRKFSTE